MCVAVPEGHGNSSPETAAHPCSDCCPVLRPSVAVV